MARKNGAGGYFPPAPEHFPEARQSGYGNHLGGDTNDYGSAYQQPHLRCGALAALAAAALLIAFYALFRLYFFMMREILFRSIYGDIHMWLMFRKFKALYFVCEDDLCPRCKGTGMKNSEGGNRNYFAELRDIASRHRRIWEKRFRELEENNGRHSW